MQTEATEHYGRVENGVVVLEKPEELADGTYVCVTPVKTNSTLGQRLLEFAGTIEGLPPDMASNHDHYVHRNRRNDILVGRRIRNREQ